MPFDPSKLSPAPWRVLGNGQLVSADGPVTGTANAEFSALARLVLAIMLKRDWRPEGEQGNWLACDKYGRPVDEAWLKGDRARTPTLRRFWDDPFTALVVADAWYRENVEETGG